MATTKKFEGTPIDAVKIKVTNTGDGLTDAMKLDDAPEIKLFSTQFVVMETVCTTVGFVGDGDAHTADRVTTLKAGIAMIVDADLVEEMIEHQRERIREMKEAEGGDRAMFDGKGKPTTDDDGPQPPAHEWDDDLAGGEGAATPGLQLVDA